MKQGVLTYDRVRLLMKKGQSGYRPGRKGERKRKSVRGCMYNHVMSAVSGVIIRKGEADLPGLCEANAAKNRALFNLEKDDDVTKFVIRKELAANDKHKARSKAPKVQRLITPVRVQRKRAQRAAAVQRAHNAKEADSAFRKIMAQRAKMMRAKKESERSRRISQASSN